MVLRLTESTQTREIKRAVSYGNKRTGPKMLGKKALTMNKRLRIDVSVAIRYAKKRTNM